jgi:hypothetical protein
MRKGTTIIAPGFQNTTPVLRLDLEGSYPARLLIERGWGTGEYRASFPLDESG